MRENQDWLRRFQEGRHAVLGSGRLGTTLKNGMKALNFRMETEPDLADIIWICIPENSIDEDLVRGIRNRNPLAVLVHTSGYLPASVLKLRPDDPAASLHPAYSFSRPLPSMPAGILWTVEGDAAVLPALEHMVSQWQGTAVRIAEERKPAYHLACVLLANLALVPIAAAETLTNSLGLDFVRMYDSLARPILGSADLSDVGNRLTGPAARGDRETISAQLEWLRVNRPDLVDLVDTLSRWILDHPPGPPS